MRASTEYQVPIFVSGCLRKYRPDERTTTTRCSLSAWATSMAVFASASPRWRPRSDGGTSVCTSTRDVGVRSYSQNSSLTLDDELEPTRRAVVRDQGLQRRWSDVSPGHHRVRRRVARRKRSLERLVQLTFARRSTLFHRSNLR